MIGARTFARAFYAWRSRPPFVRRRWILAVLLLALLAAGGRVVCGTDLFLPKPPAPFTFVLGQEIYRSTAGLVESQSRQLVPEPSPPNGNPTYTWRYVPLPQGYLKFGYSWLSSERDLWPRSWLRREELWVQTEPIRFNDGSMASVDPSRYDTLLFRCRQAVLADQRLAGRRVGVNLDRPFRWWINWRVASSDVSMVLIAVAASLAAAMLIIEFRGGSRRRRIAAGLCPRCEYSLRQSPSECCPECGERLTIYEQTIVAAMLPARPSSGADVGTDGR